SIGIPLFMVSWNNIHSIMQTDPSVKQSGNMIKRGKISKRGVSGLRRVGYLITCSVIRHDGVFKDYYFKKKRGRYGLSKGCHCYLE
ncbi:IS110 family transposase, partial [bacterium]|nr:IS110 family transposase [bacterium]